MVTVYWSTIFKKSSTPLTERQPAREVLSGYLTTSLAGHRKSDIVLLIREVVTRLDKMLPSSFLFFLATTASAAVLESLNAVPAGWKYTGAASNDEPIRLQIALQQGDAEAFEQAVIDMSTPGKIYPGFSLIFAYHVVLYE